LRELALIVTTTRRSPLRSAKSKTNTAARCNKGMEAHVVGGEA
jgi:hypothetical protein